MDQIQRLTRNHLDFMERILNSDADDIDYVEEENYLFFDLRDCGFVYFDHIFGRHIVTPTGLEWYKTYIINPGLLEGPQKPRILSEATNTYEVPQTPVAAPHGLSYSQLVDLVAQYEVMFGAIIANDKTRYEHHEARRSDGKTPLEVEGGTIFLTPRELAKNALRIRKEMQRA